MQFLHSSCLPFSHHYTPMAATTWKPESKKTWEMQSFANQSKVKKGGKWTQGTNQETGTTWSFISSDQ